VTEILTPRLHLRPFRREDLPAFVAYRREPEVARYQGWEDTYSLEDVVSVLFEDHGLHRIYAETDDRNRAVHRLFERVGFRCEGRLVEADWFKGEWSTLRIYAMLAREWRAGVTNRPRQTSS
jgi:RimJ/RimL family protein N-acetyltransferase